MKRAITPLAVALLVVGLTACQQVKSSSPLSPFVAGAMEGIEMGPPVPLQPQEGQKIKPDQQPLTLLIENASTNSPRPVFLRVEISASQSFDSVVYSQEKITPGENGQTLLTLPGSLELGRTYFWRAQADDGANASTFSSVARFELLEPVIIHAPVLMSPVGGQVVATRRPVFTARNVDRSGPHKAIFYLFEAATSPAFTNRAIVEDEFETPGATSTTASHDLAPSTQYYWRVRASDGEVLGPWSAVEAFRTPAAVSAPGPPPSSGGGGSGAPCVGPLSPLGILQCHRSKYGTPMQDHEHVQFLRDSARDFNAAGVSGGPFGLLRKTGGNNCNGYSCDILCSGQGGGQRQYDVLHDENEPQWGGPISGQLRIDVCEIQ
jgi:hypothetical protein